MPRKAQDLTPKEKALLDQLTPYPKTTHEISDDANMLSSSASQYLVRLEKKGLAIMTGDRTRCWRSVK